MLNATKAKVLTFLGFNWCFMSASTNGKWLRYEKVYDWHGIEVLRISLLPNMNLYPPKGS